MCMLVWDYSWGEQRNELPKSQSDESAPSPRVLQDARVPGSSAQALAMDVTRYSSSVFLHPHQLISGWLQRAITAPFFWCLRQKTERRGWEGGHTTGQKLGNNTNTKQCKNYYISVYIADLTGRDQALLSPGQVSQNINCKGADNFETYDLKKIFKNSHLREEGKQKPSGRAWSILHLRKPCAPYLYTTTGILFQDLKEATLSSSLSVIHTGTSSFWG